MFIVYQQEEVHMFVGDTVINFTNSFDVFRGLIFSNNYYLHMEKIYDQVLQGAPESFRYGCNSCW